MAWGGGIVGLSVTPRWRRKPAWVTSVSPGRDTSFPEGHREGNVSLRLSHVPGTRSDGGKGRDMVGLSEEN